MTKLETSSSYTKIIDKNPFIGLQALFFYSHSEKTQSEHVRFYVFVEVKHGKTATEIQRQLEESGITDIPSFTTIWRWCTSFKDESKMVLQDSQRSGRPCSATTDDNVQLVKRLITEMPKQSTRSLADDTGLSKTTIHRILTDNLGLRKVCATWVPHLLSEVNKQERIQCAQSIIQRIENHSMEDCMKFWTTEDETWLLHYTPPTKENNKAWLSPSAPRPKVLLSSLTNQKVLLLIAFTGDGKFSVEGRIPGETVTSDVYTDFVHKTGEKWRVLRSSPTRLAELWWQHDNACPHTAAHTREFMKKGS